MEFDKIKKVALGKASEQEREEVETWLDDSAERSRFIKNAQGFYGGEEIKEEEISRRMERIWKSLPLTTERHRLVYRWATVAACAVICLGVALSIWFSLSGGEEIILAEESHRLQAVQLLLSDGSRHELMPDVVTKQIPGFKVDHDGVIRQEVLLEEQDTMTVEEKYAEIIVPRGGEYAFVLADGTKAMLNAGTRMRFPTVFNPKERKIFLEGEAYFEVAKEEHRPFLVAFHEGTVKVLGTQFNVRAYGGEDVFTTLVKGKVEVANGKETVILKPGQQCQINAVEHAMKVSEADLLVALAWKNGEFVFKNVSLEQVMEELSRWYNVEIDFDKGLFQGTCVHIYVNRSQTLKEALDILSKAWDIRYEIQGEKVIIKRR